jgi:ribosome-associated protein
MSKISANNLLHEAEIKITFICSPGPGGQNVNKVATGVLLRFNVKRSTVLPEDVRTRLASLIGKRLTLEGEVLIKATRYRTQERNKQDALNRLQELLNRVVVAPKKRKKTKPTFTSKQQRIDTKKIRGKVKSLRNKKLNERD